MCTRGVVSGSFSGCALPSPCSNPNIPTGYTAASCGSIASDSSCSAQTCASGYVGSPSGSLSCSNGVVSGSFSGCALPSSCLSPSIPAAYTASCGTIASGGACSAQSCASGYVGIPNGVLSCNNGAVSGTFSGCSLPIGLGEGALHSYCHYAPTMLPPCPPCPPLLPSSCPPLSLP